MKVRGILYSAEMIRAKLEGRKTMTRRIIKGMPLEWLNDFTPEFVADPENNLCPFGKVGDLLYAKETFTIDSRDKNDPGYYYKADFKDEDTWKGFWKPSIFMPRAAARIIDIITGIKAERLRDITSADIVKEGAVTQEFLKKNGIDKTFTQWFKLWTSIHGDYNPDLWLWVIETRNITTKGWSDVPQTS